MNRPLVLSGRKFSSKEIALIQSIIAPIKSLSLQEIAFTICENMSWKNAKGSLKINSCLVALDKLAEMGYISLPQKRKHSKHQRKKIEHSSRTDPKPTNNTPINDLGEIYLVIPTSVDEISLWKEYIDRYHYLKYKQPFGNFLRYFVKSKTNNEILGCLLFAGSALTLKERDSWIGWDSDLRRENRNLIIGNHRFLILPWININNLASKVLSLVSKQVAPDWYEAHKELPVLIETFVDKKYSGTCYQAANWVNLGETSGRGRNSQYQDPKSSKKQIYALPLVKNFRQVLLNKTTRRYKIKSLPSDHDNFFSLWSQIGSTIIEIAQKHDESWIKRNRVINSMILILLIFRILFSKNKKGYQTIIDEFWISCRTSDIQLPQKNPVRASAFTEARKKLDENIFKQINSTIISKYRNNLEEDIYKWKGHDIYAIDGSKVNLPSELKHNGYTVPGKCHYTQGLLSTLYQLKSKIPVDFSLTTSTNERDAALAHLLHLKERDLVIYDRGYLSFELLHFHKKNNIHAVFRVQKNSFNEIKEFGESPLAEKESDLFPCHTTLNDLKKKYPFENWQPLKVRLVKYRIKDTTFCLAVTLLDKELYTRNELADLYHGRWGIEELYHVSKNIIDIEDLHAKHERGVKQEIYAHFAIITINRLISNTIEESFEDNQLFNCGSNSLTKGVQINFKNCLARWGAKVEQTLLSATSKIKEIMKEMMDDIKKSRTRNRLNRSYERISKKPIGKWRIDKREQDKKIKANRTWPLPVLAERTS